ncbi:hypothetical protein [Halococcus sp. AFM35]|uniref:hypothetical protein n=1 Tax=Halococcus sp. AFM35 TaxID=3421653 RepID=UPI003EBECE17
MTHAAAEPTLEPYTDEEHGYRLVSPAHWSVDADADGGATFDAPDSDVGAVVFVDRDGRTAAAAATAFLDELDADAYVTGLDVCLDENRRLTSGERGRLLECTYRDDAGERWRLCYLFVTTDDTGYTFGIDWHDGVAFAPTAAVMVDSFAVTA